MLGVWIPCDLNPVQIHSNIAYLCDYIKTDNRDPHQSGLSHIMLKDILLSYEGEFHFF